MSKYIKFTWDCQTRYGKVISIAPSPSLNWPHYHVMVPTIGRVRFYNEKTNYRNVEEITEEEYLAATILES